MIKPVARNSNFSCCSQISSTVVWYVHPTAWHISHCFPIWQLHNGVNFSRPYLSVTSVSSLQFPISKLEVRVQITACVSELLILWSHSGLGEQITYAGSFYVKRLGRRSVNTQQSVPKRDNMAWFKQWVSSPRCSPFGNSRHYIYRYFRYILPARIQSRRREMNFHCSEPCHKFHLKHKYYIF